MGERRKTTVDDGPSWLAPARDELGAREVLALVVAWSADEPSRAGEVALVDRESCLGRGEEGLELWRQRPGANRPAGPLRSQGISRRQLLVRPDGGALHVERVGRRKMSVGGVRTDEATLRPGDSLLLEGQLILLCARRPALLPSPQSYDVRELRGFGEPDAHGIVGESPAVWELREQLAFCAASDRHVLVLGESGTGKELAARAIHALSRTPSGPFIARNAATMPEGVVDAELFGHARNFPNAGMPERQGLIGAADGGTLFLDEIGELPAALQAKLLRVLDAGEYQRLGESASRRASFRLLAATNRDPSELKHDVVARLPLRVELPGLGDRKEDVPLLARALLLRTSSAAIERVTGEFPDGSSGPRIDPALVEALLAHRFDHHVRELEQILWRSLETSRKGYLALTDAVRELLRPDERQPRGEPSREQIEAALASHGGSVGAAWRDLGLASRYALYRLLRKHGIERADG